MEMFFSHRGEDMTDVHLNISQDELSIGVLTTRPGV